MSHKRCPHCNLNPLPTDIAFFWGDTADEQAEPLCRYCRGRYRREASLAARTLPREPTRNMPMNILPAPASRTNYRSGSAVVVIVQKLVDLPGHLLTEYLLGQSLRDTLRLRSYSCDCFLTDGERLWPWEDYPTNRECPLDWDVFHQRYSEWDLWQPTLTGIEKLPDDVEVNGFEHIMM